MYFFNQNLCHSEADLWKTTSIWQISRCKNAKNLFRRYMNVFSVFRSWIFQYFFWFSLIFGFEKRNRISIFERQFDTMGAQWATRRRGPQPIRGARFTPPRRSIRPRNPTKHYDDSAKLHTGFRASEISSFLIFWKNLFLVFFFWQKNKFFRIRFTDSRDFSCMSLGYMKFRACRFWLLLMIIIMIKSEILVLIFFSSRS